MCYAFSLIVLLLVQIIHLTNGLQHNILYQTQWLIKHGLNIGQPSQFILYLLSTIHLSKQRGTCR